jgi:acyl-homoserine lactone acylase PvdQ
MVLVALLATMAIVPATALAGAERDYAGTALNIIPSGQYGSVPPPEGADEQARMYNALTPLFRNVTDADLNRLFKPARFGTAGQGPLRVEPIPRPGVRVVRDRYNVPHITGRRRADVVFAAGWVTAQDRGLVLTVARGPGYVAALDVPGIDAFGLVTDLIDFDPSPQAQRFMSRQTELLRRSGPKGRQVVRDIDSFIAGINAYFRAQGSDEEPFTRNDIYGFNALLSSLFGEGGGNESASSMLLDALRTAHGRDRGTDIWNDLREENDPETSFTVPKAFPYEQNRQPGPGNVIIKNGSFQQIYPAGPEVARAASGAGVPRRGEMSNALLISKERSANGHPLFVAGPQIGYFYPGLTMEMDVQGGGMSWRGATSAPFPGYMLIGRGPDFAMSLTSASGDVTDEFAETLCGGSTTRYMFKGRCIPMRRFDAGTLHLPSGPRRIVFYETVHGPVMGYATTTDGRRVAISEHRTNRGREALFQLAFQDLSTGKVRSAETFMRAMNQSPLTFNSFYADDRDVAMFTAGRYPIRPASLDPDLLINGNGNYEYRGYLPFNRHPQGKNPPSGTLINWNNKPAPEFRAADDNFSWGAVHRNQMLVSEIARRRTHTLATVTGAMNAGATQDIRVLRVWPVIEDVITSLGWAVGRCA